MGRFNKCLLWLVLVALLPIKLTQAEQLPYYYGAEVGNTSFAGAGGGDPGFSMYLGQYLKDKFLIEAGYASLGEGGPARTSVEASALYGGALLSLPVLVDTQPGISFFITGGLTSWYYKATTEKDSGVDVYYGLGLMYALDQNLSMRFSMKKYVLNPVIADAAVDEEIMVLGLGVQYRP